MPGDKAKRAAMRDIEQGDAMRKKGSLDQSVKAYTMAIKMDPTCMLVRPMLPRSHAAGRATAKCRPLYEPITPAHARFRVQASPVCL